MGAMATYNQLMAPIKTMIKKIQKKTFMTTFWQIILFDSICLLYLTLGSFEKSITRFVLVFIIIYPDAFNFENRLLQVGRKSKKRMNEDEKLGSILRKIVEQDTLNYVSKHLIDDIESNKNRLIQFVQETRARTIRLSDFLIMYHPIYRMMPSYWVDHHFIIEKQLKDYFDFTSVEIVLVDDGLEEEEREIDIFVNF